jgi:hypothetical protein
MGMHSTLVKRRGMSRDVRQSLGMLLRVRSD